MPLASSQLRAACVTQNEIASPVITHLIGNCRLLELDVHGDNRGSLVAIERGGQLPFDVARVYYIFNVAKDTDRGFHAHRDLTQWLICVSGSCAIEIDNGSERRKVWLEKPNVALEIGPMTWREMRNFSHDAVLLVLASGRYDPTDYIHHYDDFLSMVAA